MITVLVLKEEEVRILAVLEEMAIPCPEPKNIGNERSLAARKKSEDVHSHRKLNPVQKEHVFPKVKMAPAKDLTINILEILRKGLVLGLSLLPVEMVSHQKLQDLRCLAV